MNLPSNQFLKDQAKGSSSATLLKPIAPGANRNDVWIKGTKIIPKLISDLLINGHSVKFCAPGDSMYPTIRDGDIITVTPIEAASINKGDIILYRHKSGVVVHRVMRTAKTDASDAQPVALSPLSCFLIRGDAAVVFDDPVSADQILGKVTRIERKGRRVDPYSLKSTLCFKARRAAARLKNRLLCRSHPTA